ncbi:MAG: site-specific integrase [Bacteroidetes bacterium]|nr:site-specific integrase [Bacteroidota bacterium]
MKYKFFLADPQSASETTILLFVRRTIKSEDGLRSQRQTTKISTSERIKPKAWNQQKQRVLASYSGAVELNIRLERIINRAKEFNDNLARDGRKLSPTQYRTEIIDFIFGNPIESKRDFWDAFNRFTSEKETKRGLSTIRKYKNLQRLLEEFSQIRTVDFESMNPDFYRSLQNYFVKEKKYVNTTTNKNFKLLRTFMKWAELEELTTNKGWKGFEFLPQHKPNVVYLSKAEIESILYYDFSKSNLSDATIEAYERARDLFCFGCYTGQRWGDISKITRNQIKGNFWSVSQEKTDTPVRIPLSDPALYILSKYKSDTYPLPRVSSTKVNKHIKEIARLAGIDEPITIVKNKGTAKEAITKQKWELLFVHRGRSSFITISLLDGMQPEVIMNVSGHTDYKTMQSYIKITEKITESEVNRVWNKKPDSNMKVV